MATKLAKNGTYMEYIVIRPTFGFSLDQIATAILMYHSNTYDYQNKTIVDNRVRAFFKKNDTWNKIMGKVKDIILEEGLSRLDYAWESIDNYESQLENVKQQIKDRYNSLIGTKKEK